MPPALGMRSSKAQNTGSCSPPHCPRFRLLASMYQRIRAKSHPLLVSQSGLLDSTPRLVGPRGVLKAFVVKAKSSMFLVDGGIL